MESAVSSGISIFFNYGAIGVIAVVALYFAWRQIQRLEKRAEEVDAENKRLNGMIIDKTTTAINDVSSLNRDTVSLLRDVGVLLQEFKVARDVDKAVQVQMKEQSRLQDARAARSEKAFRDEQLLRDRERDESYGQRDPE